MEKYNTIQINNNDYYISNDTYDFDSSFFYGTNNNIRNIVDKKKIPEEDHVYAYVKNNEWIISNKKYNKSKLLLSKEWCMDNIPKFAKNSKIESDVEKLPPLLNLKDDEQFSDDEFIYNIKMRGERKKNKCYFNAKDISNLFNLPNLHATIIHKGKGYKIHTHYKYFITGKLTKDQNLQNKNSKLLYLTYKGLIKCLYCSHSPKAEQFQDWAENILFTHQFGNEKEKGELASKLLGVNYKVVREVFKSSSTSIPCVYLFTLGTGKELRKSMKLSDSVKDDDIICKYGMTDNLERRAYQHGKTFQGIKNTDLCLKYYSYIDPQYISEAETDISDFFSLLNVKIKCGDMVEIVSLDQKVLNNQIKKKYVALADLYGGHIKELVAKIKSLEDKLLLQEERHKNELLEKEKEIMELKKDKEIQKLDYENKLMKLELEFLRKK